MQEKFEVSLDTKLWIARNLEGPVLVSDNPDPRRSKRRAKLRVVKRGQAALSFGGFVSSNS